MGNVYCDETDIVTWHFSTNITADPIDAAGLTINGEAPMAVIGHGGADLSLQYPSTHADGEPWDCDGPQAGMTFTGGAVLQPGSGLTEFPP